MLKLVLAIPPPGPGGQPPTQETVLENLPRGCTQFMVHDEVLYNGHWYTVACSPTTGHRYNLDSMIYRDTGGHCKRMED
jgi:hypothetical protein